MGKTGKGGFGDNPQNINRKGRPKKGTTLTDILKKYGKKREVEINGKKFSRNDALAIILWEMAIAERNLTALKYIYDRIDGMPIQTVGMEHDFNEEFTDIIKNIFSKKDKKIKKEKK